MEKVKRFAQEHRWLLFLGALGLVLRLSTLTWGTGVGAHMGMYHPDEHKLWRSISNFPESYLNNHRFEYGSALQNTIAVALTPVRLARWRIYEPWFGDAVTYEQFTMLAFRVVSCLMGAGSIVLTFFLGERLYDRRVGWLAAILLCLSFYHVIYSPVCSVDVPMSFVFLVNMFLCVRAFDRKRWKDFVWLGFATGYMVGMKVYGVFFGVFPAIYLVGSFRCWPIRDLLLKCFVYVVVALLTFVVSSPHIVLQFDKFLAFFLEAPELWKPDYAASLKSMLMGLPTATTHLLTLPLAILTGVGLLWSWPGKQHPLFKLWLGIPLYLCLWMLQFKGWIPSRYLIIIAPIFCLLGAIPFSKLLAMGWRRSAYVLAVAAVVWSSCATGMAIGAKLNDTRTQAGQYIAEEFPRGVRLAVASAPESIDWRWHTWRYPKFNEHDYEIVSILDEPDYVLTTSISLGRVSTVFKGELLDESYNLPAGKLWWFKGEVPTPDEFRFYEELLNTSGPYELLASWKSFNRLNFYFPPPEIRIYQRKP